MVERAAVAVRDAAAQGANLAVLPELYTSGYVMKGKKVAVGGVTFSGILAVAGCFLIGCCGSPMFVVWLNIFGAAFIPFAKPFIALVTTISITAAWVWMYKRNQHNVVSLSRFPDDDNLNRKGNANTG